MQPLREGGSLPALAEADDDFKYVVKFKGGGHGVKTLIAGIHPTNSIFSMRNDEPTFVKNI